MSTSRGMRRLNGRTSQPKELSCGLRFSVWAEIAAPRALLLCTLHSSQYFPDFMCHLPAATAVGRQLQRLLGTSSWHCRFWGLGVTEATLEVRERFPDGSTPRASH